MVTLSKWSKDRYSRLNAAGKTIEFVHNDKPYRAVVEAMDEDGILVYYTVIFDVSGEKPWPTVSPHEKFYDKQAAKAHLTELMQDYS